MDGKGLTCATRDWQTPIRIDRGDPQQLLPPVRDQIRQLDSGLPVFDVTTMNAQVQYGKPLLPARLGAMLVGAFGLLGLVLASVGVFGVVSYSVSQRTHEIGIRSALGAQRFHVLAMILRQGMSMAFKTRTKGE